MHRQRIIPLERSLHRRVPRVECSRSRRNRSTSHVERIGVVAAEFLGRDAVRYGRPFHLVAWVAIIAVTRDAHSAAARQPVSELTAPLRLSIIESITTA